MSDRSHYEVLGLEPKATADEVRRRFRELARKYHPDLNREHPEYHEVFVQISQAYEVLSDISRRARYDLDLRDRARREQFNAAYGASTNGSRAAATPPTPPPSAQNGHRAPNGSSRPRPSAPPRASRAAREAEARKQAVLRMMEDARNNYSRGHLGEAIRICNEVLQMQRVGAAHELLGDVYQRQGRLEEAVNAYTLAAQMVPSNGLVMAKLNRVAQRIRTQNPDYQGAGRHVQRSNRTGYRMAVGSFGFAVVLFLVMWSGNLNRGPRTEPLIGEWTVAQIGMFALCGALTGAILAAGAWLRPIDQELFFTGVGAPRRGMPLGLLLMVVGALFYPAAFAAYLVFARLQESLSGSVMAVLLATAGLTLGFVFAADRALMQTLLFGGNVIYVAMMLGWIIGDLFRPGWSA